jgi:hypothetical protein
MTPGKRGKESGEGERRDQGEGEERKRLTRLPLIQLLKGKEGEGEKEEGRGGRREEGGKLTRMRTDSPPLIQTSSVNIFYAPSTPTRTNQIGFGLFFKTPTI